MNHERPNAPSKSNQETQWSELEELGKNGSYNTYEQINTVKGYEETDKLLRPGSPEANQNIPETPRDRNRSLGGRILSITGAVKEAITKKAKQITGREIIGRSYFTDRYDRNIQYLEQQTRDKEAFDPAEVYKDLMHDFPELRNVKVVGFYDNNAYANYLMENGDEDYPEVLFNLDPNAYIAHQSEQSADFQNLPRDKQEELLKENYYDYDLDILASKKTAPLVGAIKAISIKMGKSPDELMHNKKLMSTFFLVHEFGHQLDFRRNYLNPRLEQQLQEKGKITDRLQAIRESKFEMDKRRSDDGHDEITEGRYKSFGHNLTTRTSRRGELYRNRQSEMVADTVAIDFIIKYAGKYNFFEQGSKPIYEDYNQKYQEKMDQKQQEELSEAEWTRLRTNLNHGTWNVSVLSSLYRNSPDLLVGAQTNQFANDETSLTEYRDSAMSFLKNALGYTKQCVDNRQKFGEHFSTGGTSGYDASPDLKTTLSSLAGYNNWLLTEHAKNKDYQGDKAEDVELKVNNAVSRIALEDFSIISDLIGGRPSSKEEIKKRYQQLSINYRHQKMDAKADRLEKIYQSFLSNEVIYPL